MFVRLLLVLMIVPVAELFVMLRIHGAIAGRYGTATGLLVTVGGVLFTGVLGAWLARAQGLGVLRELQRAMAEGRPPGRTLVDGALVLVGGVLLLTPGFLTDLVGLTLLIPATRAGYRRLLSAWLERKLRRGEVFVRYGGGPTGRGQGPGSAHGRVIDVTPDEPGQGRP